VSRILKLQQWLQDTNSAISRAERAVAGHPGISSAAATLTSFLKMRDNLEAEFLAEANLLEMDACSYRVVPDDSRPAIIGLTAVLGDFQRLFTTVYDAVINGPKQIAKASEKVVADTSLGFAYSYPGSIGFMLTLKNERLLLSSTDLDAAMKGVFDLMRVTTTTEAAIASKRWGVAALRVAHEWADANSEAKFGADITWLRKDQEIESLQLQRPEIMRLAATIRQTTETSEAEVTGELTMVDNDKKTFRIKTEDAEIEGKFGDGAIDPFQPASVPGYYKATIRTARKLISDGDLAPEHELMKLAPL
jgi:hypothetical protein